MCSNEVYRDEDLIPKCDEVGPPRQVEGRVMSGGKQQHPVDAGC